MPNPIEQELGLGPVVHRARRWLQGNARKLGINLRQEGTQVLDPLTVNYAAWEAVRKHTREWPTFREAPNSLEIYVSTEDWDEYWGIDTDRKEESVSVYVARQAAQKGLWLAGDPQVVVLPDETLDIGDVDITWQFSEPKEAERSSATDPDASPSLGLLDKTNVVAPGEPASLPFADSAAVGHAKLEGEGDFCLLVYSGDCIGAVSDGEPVPPEVNVRLDAQGFAYVAVKQCSIGVLDGSWVIQNHSPHGTMLLTRHGSRFMLGGSEPFVLHEGDIVYLGPSRPLRFALC